MKGYDVTVIWELSVKIVKAAVTNKFDNSDIVHYNVS
jgi:hypothetical protein